MAVASLAAAAATVCLAAGKGPSFPLGRVQRTGFKRTRKSFALPAPKWLTLKDGPYMRTAAHSSRPVKADRLTSAGGGMANRRKTIL